MKTTAGRDYLGDIAPEFASYNDDVLFGEVWSDERLSPKMRSIATISSLMGAGILDESLRSHIEMGKAHGITKEEMSALITHLSFYAGWPKAWSAYSYMAEIYKEETPSSPLFGLGEELNDPEHFSGKVYVKEFLGFDYPMMVDNVTFEPGCINNYHTHTIGQHLFVLEGCGWYQEEGKPAQFLKAGDVVHIPANVKHWHGAAKNSWFTHLTLEDPSKGAPTWYERISQEEYDQLGEE